MGLFLLLHEAIRAVCAFVGVRAHAMAPALHNLSLRSLDACRKCESLAVVDAPPNAFSRAAQEQKIDIKVQCAICLNDISLLADPNDAESAWVDACAQGHVFHVKCLRDNVLRKGSVFCPTCTEVLSADAMRTIGLGGDG
jgi:hypothetical protein